MSQTNEPYIASNRSVPELTLKTLVIGFIASLVLCASNAYLGLFAGMTVSASIPAAVLGMGVLKLFRKGTILECNGIQTAASAGETLAAGTIFTLPALILIGYWSEFNYLQTLLITLCGGMIGVCFSIPLRRSLIVEEKLKFPEGIATSEVLITGFEGSKSLKFLVWGGLIGALMKFSQSGLKVIAPLWERAVMAKDKFLYAGFDFSPALLGVGYIVGFNTATVIFIGAIISWWVAIPIMMAGMDIPATANLLDVAYGVWDSKIRYLGVGGMIIGGLWTLVKLRGTIASSFTQGFDAFFAKKKGTSRQKRTEKDLPMSLLIRIIVLFMIPALVFFYGVTKDMGIMITAGALMLIAGFLFSAVLGYMAGVVGSSNNPTSGISIATMLLSALIIATFFTTDGLKGPAIAILIGSFVACGASISGDNLQDLKSGHLLGATPWRQEIMQFVGIIAAALVLGPVLNLLNEAYTIGSKELSAPQANLMKNVVMGAFGKKLPWEMIYWGGALGIVAIALDEYLQKTKASWRFPVLAMSVGIYLPFELDSTIFIGGLIPLFASKVKIRAKSKKRDPKAGILIASGLITGEALTGILLAIPVAIYGTSKVLQVEHSMGVATEWIGAFVMLGLIYWIYNASKGVKSN